MVTRLRPVACPCPPRLAPGAVPIAALSLVAWASMAFAAQPVMSAKPPSPAPADPPPTTWDVGGGEGPAVVWRAGTGGWKAGSLAVAGDALLVGTNRPLGDARDQAVLRCVDARTGVERWRVEHDRLPRRANDIPASPIASVPAVDDGRVYYVSNRGELCCVGLADGRPVWTIDMPRDLGVFKRDVNDAGCLAPSPVVAGDAVYCVTGNGGDHTDAGWRVPAPRAPSFVAADKRTGKVRWSSASPGEGILYGQWSTPAVATVGGARQVLFPGGDGVLYGFEPLTGKALWKVDCRGPRPQDRRDFAVAPPLVFGGTAYVSPNRDPEQNGSTPRPILAIDLATRAVRWSFADDGFDGTFGPMACSGGLLYAVGFSGLLVAVDPESGKVVWRRQVEEQGDVRGGVCLHDGRVYVAGYSGVHVVAARDGRWVGRFDLGDGMTAGTPVVSDGRLHVATDNHVWALRLPP